MLRSPDHFAVSTPATPGPFAVPVRRSRGYEGMAASPDGRFLYPRFEGPLWDEQAKAWESRNGREYLRILEFDVAQGRFSGRSWKYLLEVNDNNIGDFNMIDATTGLIIERDNGEGDARLACNGPARPDCFNVPARFKRVYKIDLSQPDADGFVRKIGFVDLLDIKDPESKARTGSANGVFTFPFVTIENVDVVDADHIVGPTTTTCRFPRAARSARTTTTSSSCCAFPHPGHDDACGPSPGSPSCRGGVDLRMVGDAVLHEPSGVMSVKRWPASVSSSVMRPTIFWPIRSCIASGMQ